MARKCRPDPVEMSLTDQLDQACNGYILEHIAVYNKETDCERSYELMAPGYYGDYAQQACRDVGAIVLAGMEHLQAENAVSGGSALERLRPNAGTYAEVLNR